MSERNLNPVILPNFCAYSYVCMCMCVHKHVRAYVRVIL